MSYRVKPGEEDYSKELAGGRVVRGYVGKRQSPDKELKGMCVYSESAPNSTITQPVLIVFPPEPLEITGWVCDTEIENSTICEDNACSPADKKEHNCRPVTLVEKKECSCESQ